MEAAFFLVVWTHGYASPHVCPFAIRHSPLVTRHSPFATRHSPLNHDDNSRPSKSCVHDTAAPQAAGESSHASRSF